MQQLIRGRSVGPVGLLDWSSIVGLVERVGSRQISRILFFVAGFPLAQGFGPRASNMC